MPSRKPNTADEDWKAAQAALEAARQLPAGVERFEALKEPGQLRYDADKKRTRETEQNRPWGLEVRHPSTPLNWIS
jgi:hypothetical protein